ncbi:MAG: DUF692 domain-containing protein [Cocleimonas sp.]|nr:DUF692 domain-containing protein [Cocleimonas sp.]
MKSPPLGFGLGLRKEHYQAILDTSPNVDWFEVLSENYLVPGGKPLYFLDAINERYPMVMHGVSLSIGNNDALNFDYLQQLKTLSERINAHWISDHLCWSGLDGVNAHDLLPLPYTAEAVTHVATRIKQVQDFLERRILIENVSSYVSYTQSAMTEWEFLSAVAEEADCLLLLDVNNIYVSSVNHEFDPLDYLNGVPKERVQQHHLAGHSDYGDYIIDTHDHDIVDPVWNLYAEAVKRFGHVSAMIERDDNIPDLSVLMQEYQQMKQISAGVLGDVFTGTQGVENV